MTTWCSIFILIICSLFFVDAKAQIDFEKFALDSFQFPSIDRKALRGTGSLNALYKGVDDPESELDYVHANLSNAFGLIYDRFINQPDLQATHFISINSLLRFQHNESTSLTNIKTSSTEIQPRITFSGNRKKYKGRAFFEAGLFSRLTYGFEKTKTFDTNTTIFKENSYGVTIIPTIGFGKGRLEPVSDVAMAMFILKDAEELGLDVSGVSSKEIYDFASLMAEVSNRRIFDTRRLRIQELRELYSFMQNKGWVLPNDPGFFTVLTDNWIYTNAFNRLSGKRWSYLVEPEFDYAYNGIFVLSDQDRHIEVGASLIVDYRNYKPISLYKDNVRLHRASLKFVEIDRDIIILNEPLQSLEFRIDNSIGRRWYPNNRTSIFASLFADYTYYHPLKTHSFFDLDEQHVVSTGISADAIYFLSYRTQLAVRGLLNYAYSNGGQLVGIIAGFGSSRRSTGFHAFLDARIVVDIF